MKAEADLLLKSPLPAPAKRYCGGLWGLRILLVDRRK